MALCERRATAFSFRGTACCMRLSKYRIENWTWVGQRTRWRASYPDMAASVVWVFFEPAREDGPLRYLPAWNSPALIPKSSKPFLFGTARSNGCQPALSDGSHPVRRRCATLAPEE